MEKMFQTPTPADIRWTDIVSMPNAAGVDIHERSGSRVLLKKEQKGIVVHRPHPEPETDRGTVRLIVDFLKKTEVRP